MSETNNKQFIFAGGQPGSGKTNLVETIKRDNPNVIVIAGKVKFDVELNLIENLDIMLSMDSGNAHIAAMLGVKVITLWGGTHPYAGFSPFNQPLDYCITADRQKYPLLPSSVYGNKVLEGYEDVMRSIDPNVVCEKVIQEIRKP